MINAIIEKNESWLIELRRRLHRIPEIGDQEFETAKLIEEELHAMGIDTERILDTGIVATIEGNGAGKTVAIRADIDALPIEENSGVEYTSEHKGAMHACGHDAHTAILIGTAKVLLEIKQMLAGTVKLIFQPAEESIGGAERMIAAGCLKNPDVDFILGLHVAPELSAGTLSVKFGKMHAASDRFEVKVKGLSSHGAEPHNGVDAIVVASDIIVNLQTIISRNISPLNSAVITVGMIHGGSAENVIANEVVFGGTIRTLDSASREFVKSRFQEVVNHIAASHGAQAEISFEKGYDPLINDFDMISRVKEIGEKNLGKENVIEKEFPTMGVEDMAFYLQAVKGTFFEIGSGFDCKTNPPLHNDKFKINEDCLKTGVLMETSVVLSLLDRRSKR